MPLNHVARKPLKERQRAAFERDSTIEQLRAMTPAQVAAWVSSRTTPQKDALLARIICYLLGEKR